MWEEGASGESSSNSKALVPVTVEKPKNYDAIFNDLMWECKHSAPGARLSARLRTSLERLSLEERRTVCSMTREGCSPLFVSCKRGNVEIVEYLINVCNADIEQVGIYEVPDDRSVHTVTPLWCAAVAGKLEVLRVLAEAGANVNAGSDSGSTPVRSACFMTNLDVVRYLVNRGADIHRPNHNGGTCLINSVQSVRLCLYLLEHGAEVDARDNQHKTALHYAIQEHRVETTRLLLDRGANPHLASRSGDDALRTACLKGASQVVALLASRVQYPTWKLADAYELLGATNLDDFNDMSAALAAWTQATALRHSSPEGYIEKLPVREPHPALDYAKEWRTVEELEAIATDMDAMRHQSLLVAERVLGPAHKDTVYRLMYRGASYADAFRYKRCIALWTYALQIRMEKDSLLFTDTCHTACALTRLLLDARGGRLERGRGAISHDQVSRVFSILSEKLPEARKALEVRPIHKKQAETFDRAMRCITHLIYLLLETAETEEDHRMVREKVRALVLSGVRSAHTGDTLLHLCVSRLNFIRSTYFADEIAVPPIFPNVSVVSLLLDCGASVRIRNEARSTALHVAAIPYNFSTEVVEVLLAGGAHLDQPNKFGDSAAELVALNRTSRIKILDHMSLACRAAKVLIDSRQHVPPGTIPRTLEAFLDLHRP